MLPSGGVAQADMTHREVTNQSPGSTLQTASIYPCGEHRAPYPIRNRKDLYRAELHTQWPISIQPGAMTRV